MAARERARIDVAPAFRYVAPPSQGKLGQPWSPQRLGTADRWLRLVCAIVTMQSGSSASVAPTHGGEPTAECCFSAVPRSRQALRRRPQGRKRATRERQHRRLVGHCMGFGMPFARA